MTDLSELKRKIENDVLIDRKELLELIERVERSEQALEWIVAHYESTANIDVKNMAKGVLNARRILKNERGE